MKNIRRNIQTYLRRTLGRDNDSCGAYSGTVNAVQNQFVKFPVPHAARRPANSKQFDAIIRGHDRLDPANGGARRQPERLQKFPVDAALALHRVAREQIVEQRLVLRLRPKCRTWTASASFAPFVPCRDAPTFQLR
ncbi:hypothetical protein ACTGJ9_036605 [Bradyrhizobium sp. RDM12]